MSGVPTASPPRDRRIALAGIIAVVAFVGAWAGCGLARRDYSPVNDAISRLAAIGAPHRAWMTAGFVVFGIGVTIFARSLRAAVGGPAWIAAVVTGLASVGVAAAPLGRADRAHYVFAVIGYVSLAGMPMLAAPEFTRVGAHRWALGSAVAAAGSAIFLSLSAIHRDHGLTQRIGLGFTDAWIVAVALRRLWPGISTDGSGTVSGAG